ncbi:MAG: mannose-1-phosphate guanylyltransferase/mannose-6-phosphate isomerase [Bauldia sp.]|nr:mannose-1-phosphate guanylyltransferase/mannose-6-phosphate isomerase [Bauldia sp.]
MAAQHPATIVPVILSGGSGTRLWPASRVGFPKQFLSLTGGRSLLQDTLARFGGRPGFGAPLVVGAEEHRFVIQDQAREIGAGLAGLLVEPVARNTAPAIASAAVWLESHDPDALMLVAPADHSIGRPEQLLAAVVAAAPAAREGWLVTFGIAPSGPDTAYGYVTRSREQLGEGVWRSGGFREKPDRASAAALIAGGDAFWNSGLFLFRPSTLLAAMTRHAPSVVEAARQAVDGGSEDLGFLRLAKAPLERIEGVSIDYALMQAADNVALAPVEDCGWSDIGSWDALFTVLSRGEPNVSVGEAIHVDSTGVLGYLTDGRLLVTLGVTDLVVVSTQDALLVARRDRAQDLRLVVEQLRAVRPGLLREGSRVYRPWGHYETLHLGDRHQVKHLWIKPGARTSLQRHVHRAEHWVVVKGTARITHENAVEDVTENQSVYLPIGARHRLENPGRIPLSLIEIQTGSYLGEDDIERFDDAYGRH